MYYEINVSLNGKHLFATAERSIVTERGLWNLLCLFREKFPKEEGYEISCYKCEKTNKFLEEEDLEMLEAMEGR